MRPLTLMLKAEKILKGHLRISRKGVPHIIVSRHGTSFSICRFGKRKIWRVFYPYPSYLRPQIKKDFSSIIGVINFLK